MLSGIPLLMFFALAPGAATKSAREIAENVLQPAGFTLVLDEQSHGTAIISKELRRSWDGPGGVQMALVLDDTEAIDSYGVTEQRRYAVEQIQKLYPDEKFEGSHLFVVNKKEWILMRTRGDHRMTKYRHFILLTHLQGQYITLHFFGPDESLKDILGYIEFTMRQVSGATPDQPINAM
jgi:hypothetical protein